MQNLIYAVIQVVHNIGAVTVVGVPASVLWLARDNAALQHRLSYLVAAGWATQAASGLLFGATTYFYEGHLPDIHGIAVDALLVKVSCVIMSFMLASAYVKLNGRWSAARRSSTWRILLAFAVIALGSAAFLRWFS